MRLNFLITNGSYSDLGNNKFYFYSISFKYTGSIRKVSHLGTILIYTK